MNPDKWKLYEACQKKHRIQKPRDIFTHVVWGRAGVGKTRMICELNPDVYCVPLPSSPSDHLFWDEYTGQDAILFDDFQGEIDYDLMLRLLDGYQFWLDQRAHRCLARWTKVYITSRQPPASWYSHTDALLRRINSVEHLTVPWVPRAPLPPIERDERAVKDFGRYLRGPRI